MAKQNWCQVGLTTQNNDYTLDTHATIRREIFHSEQISKAILSFSLLTIQYHVFYWYIIFISKTKGRHDLASFHETSLDDNSTLHSRQFVSNDWSIFNVQHAIGLWYELFVHHNALFLQNNLITYVQCFEDKDLFWRQQAGNYTKSNTSDSYECRSVEVYFHDVECR